MFVNDIPPFKTWIPVDSPPQPTPTVSVVVGNAPTGQAKLGYNVVLDRGEIQSTHGAANTTLILNPAGGPVTTKNNTLDDGSANGVIRIGPAQFAGPRGFGFAAGFASPNAGRIIIGDGSGWSAYVSSVNIGGAYTDLVRFQDNGNTEFYSTLTCHQNLYSHFGAIVGGGGTFQDQYGSVNFNGGVLGNAWMVNDQNGRFQFKVTNQAAGVNAGALVRTFNNILDDGTGAMTVPGKLTLGSGYSAANPGWTTLPGGIIMQWGSFTVLANSSGNTTVNFPKIFPGTCFNATAALSDSNYNSVSGAPTSAIGVSTISTTQVVLLFKSSNTNAVAITIYWQAIGN